MSDSDRDRPVMTSTALPGTYVDCRVSPSLPRVEDFIGRPFSRGLAREARRAVQILRDHAERLGQYYVTEERFESRAGVSGRTEIRAYFGESSEALAEAYKIRETVNHHIRMTIWSDHERSLLWID